LPDIDFLEADVTFDHGALEVTFCINATMITPELADLLSFQLRRLNLNQRYPRQINKFLSEQRAGILSVLALAPGELPQFFRRSADTLAESFGRNDWRVALLRALAANDDFCTDPEYYLGTRGAADADGGAAQH
jgi:hypothetical protein